MKKFLQVWLIVLTLFCLLAGQCVTAAADSVASESWDIEKSVSLWVTAAYGNEILDKGVEAFDFQVNEICITQKAVSEYGIGLKLLLIFDDDAQMDSALSLLEEDVRFTDVNSNQAVNTLRLQADSDSIKVGETLTIRREGILKFAPSMNAPYETIEVKIDDYDPQREYTVSDFPQYAFSSVKKISATENSAWFSLKLENPGYYNFYRAIHALALDSAVLNVHSGEYFYTPAIVYLPEWKISDPSVAEFITSVPNENGDAMVIQGLQAGTITVTYIPSFGHYLGKDYAVTYEITVIDENIASGTTETDDTTNEITGNSALETNDITDETTGSSTSGSSSPQTGDREFAVLCLVGLASFIGMAVSGAILYKKKNCC